VVGFGVFVGHAVWIFGRFCIFVGHRSENDREKASVGRVVGSKFDRSEQKKGRIRREKLVVRFDSIYVTDENTNYLSAVILLTEGHRLLLDEEEGGGGGDLLLLLLHARCLPLKEPATVVFLELHCFCVLTPSCSSS
jgi:hypothetical protein